MRRGAGAAVLQRRMTIPQPGNDHAWPALSQRAWWIAAFLVALGALALAWLIKLPCAQAQPVGSGWADFDQRPIVSACYNDVVLLYRSRQLDTGAFPYSTGGPSGSSATLEYPVVSGYFMWAARGVAGVVGGGTPSVMVYYATTCALLAGCWLATVYMIGRLVGPRRATLLSVSPLLLVHAFTNWDLLAIALAIGALLLWSRGNALGSGALIGLGAAAKLFPVFLLGPLFLSALRAGSVRRRWVPTLLAAAGAWLVVNSPVIVAYPAGWLEFFRLNSTRTPEWNSLYFMVERVTGHPVPAVNVIALVLFAVACAAVTWLALTVSVRPTVAELSFLVLCSFLMTNKVWSPQYSLWLLPFLCLMGINFWAVAVWQLAEVAVWLTLTPLLGPAAGGKDVGMFLVAALVRDVALLALVGATIKRMTERRGRVRDPLGDPLESHAVESAA